MKSRTPFFILIASTGILLLLIVTIGFSGKAITDALRTEKNTYGQASSPIRGETPTSDTGTTTYVYGIKLIASKKNTIIYHLQDSISSNTITTTQTGVQQSRHTSYPYGKMLSKESTSGGVQKYTFTGKEDDGRLMYFGARYFDSRTARFTSNDPIARTGSNYEYATGNPMKYIDPTGMASGVPAESDATSVSMRQGGYSLYAESLKFTNTWVAEPFVNLFGPVFEGAGNILALPDIIGGSGTTDNLAQAAMMSGPALPAALEALGAAPGYLRALGAGRGLFEKSVLTRTHPIRFGKIYSSIEDEYNTLSQMHEVAPDNVVKPFDLIETDGAVTGYRMQKILGVMKAEYKGTMSDNMKGKIASTVQKLHDAGLVHGDLHSGNVLITPRKMPIIIDPVGYPRNMGGNKDLMRQAISNDWESLRLHFDIRQSDIPVKK